MSSEDFMTKKI